MAAALIIKTLLIWQEIGQPFPVKYHWYSHRPLIQVL